MKNLKRTMSKILKVVPALTLVLCSLQPTAQSAAYGREDVLAPPIACEESDYAVAANEDHATAFEYETDAESEFTEEPNVSVESETTAAPDASTEPDVTSEPDASIYELPEGTVDYNYVSDETRQIVSEAQNGMYFLNDNELTFYSFSSHNVESVYTFEGYIIDSYVESGKLYVYNRITYLENICHIVIYDLDNMSFEKDIPLDFAKYSYGAVGVDPEGRIYLAGGSRENTDVYLLSPEGDILSQTAIPKEIYDFSGFDAETGRFYYEFAYPVNSFELYVALGTGNTVDNVIALDEEPFKILSYHNDRSQRAAELIGGRYLCADATENRYYYNSDLLESGLYIYDITKTDPVPIYLERDYRDYGSKSDDVLGVGAVYNSVNNSIAAVTHEDNLIVEKSMSNGETLSVYKAAHPIFSLSTFGNSIVAVEKESENGIDVYYIEFIEWKSEGSQVTIKGPSDIKAGESAQLTAMIDGEIESEFEWKSSDPKIASVSNSGSVSAWNQGTAVLTATSSLGISADFTIKVSANPDITVSAGSPVSLKGEKSENFLANDCGYYSADTVKSYLTENSDGTYTRVEYIEEYDYKGKIIVEDYNKSGAKTDSLTLDMELPIFGGYFSGSEYNYLALGKTNEAESDSNEILRVIKYTKDWEKIDAASVYGANTTIPFYFGSLRMVENDGKLYIHTCHEMYTSEDGLNHQANMLYTVDENNMDVIDSGYYVSAYIGYTSHSFNQFIQTDGGNIYNVDHGDAYPRGIQLSSYSTSGNMYSGKETLTFEIYGDISKTDYQHTGVSVGGFELSSDMCIIAANSIQQNETAFNDKNSPRNIFITITDKDLNSSETKWITNYTGKSIVVGTPHLTKFGDDRLLLMWDEYNESTDKHQTKLVTLDGHGNYTSDIKTTTLPLSDCKPIMCSDNIVRWYCTNSTAPILCAVNPYNLDSAYKGGIAILGDDTPTAPPEATRRPSTPGAGGGGGGGFSGGGFSSGGGYTGGTSDTEPSYTEPPTNTTSSNDDGSQSLYGSLPFTDVSASDWYYDGVKYVYDNGLMNGTSATWFEPETTMTRGMLVTVLGRAEGVSGGSSSVFSDVNPNEYYAPYIAWASSSGIVNGVGGGKFAPDDIVTREQIAKIFKGYYEYLGDATNSSSAVDYADAHLISDWAVPGVAFCKEKGLMQGKDGNMFDPQGGATRAEAATILMRAGIGE